MKCDELRCRIVTSDLGCSLDSGGWHCFAASFYEAARARLIGYGAAAGVALHGAFGWEIAAAPAVRWVFVALLIALTLASAAYLLARGVLRELFLTLSTPTKVSLAFWLMFLALNLGLLHVSVRFPQSLPDGLYIFKTHTINVKIQYLTGLPVDNYIPFTVAEYFLRGVSFKKERPIVPGNEVSNRTILMSLVSLPFRVALGAPRNHPQLDTYNYIGRTWPDNSKLNKDDYFDQFEVIGLALNSLLLVGLFVFCSSLGANSVLPLAALLYVTDPYFIAQTIFTWPKALAGFFYPVSVDLDAKRPQPIGRRCAHGPGVSLSPVCNRLCGMCRPILSDSLAAGKISSAVGGPVSSCLWPASRALDRLDKICPAHTFRFSSAELLRTRH
jgi:hypothetical protein